MERFCGVALIAFSGLTTCEEDRVTRVEELAPVLPVLAKAIRQSAGDAHEIVMPSGAPETETPDTTIIAELKFDEPAGTTIRSRRISKCWRARSSCSVSSIRR